MRKRSVIAITAIILLATSLRSEAAEPSDARPYSGDLLSRSTLTGDWAGTRNDLAAHGIIFSANLTQVEQGVVAGGKNGSWEYGARGNLTTNLDTQKLGLWPGGFLTVEIEGNFSDSVNAKTGALMPADTNQLFPMPTGDNLNLPQLSFGQFLSEYGGVQFGKFDTMGGDANEFAHGKGDVQFFNLALNIDPVLIFAAPSSTLGAGVVILPTKDIDAAILNFSVLQANGSADKSGFDDLDSDKLTLAGEGRVRTGFFGLTGHQLVGAAYSNKQFTSIDQRIEFEPLRGRLGLVAPVTLAKKDGTWGVYYNFDQFLYEPKPRAGRGVGVFGRFGASDGNPNFMQYFFSVGVGGKGMMESRPFDQCGIGYYYIDAENPTLQGPLQTRSFLRDEWGFEAYYNIALTPWFLLTPDVQVIGPAQKRRLANSGGFGLSRESIGTASVLGVRLQLIL